MADKLKGVIITPITVRKRAAQSNLKTMKSSLPLFMSLSLCVVKTRAQRLRSNDPGDEKSRSPRADRERKGRDTEIREKDQMKANFL